MIEKISAALKQLIDSSREHSQRLEALEKVKNIQVAVKDGKDGKDAPDLETIVTAVLEQIPIPKDGETPDREAIIKDVLAQIPEPKPGRDGRDAQAVNVSDVAAIVLAKIPKPQDGKDGRNAPDLNTIVNSVKAQVKDGKPGVKGEKGDKGDKGTSITDVKLEKNKLFVWLDGVKKLAGEISIPRQVSPFSPGGGGSLGASSADFQRIRPVYGSMSITQRDTGDTNPANDIAVVAHPSGTDVLNPPAAPVPVGSGSFGGYYKVPGYIQEGPKREMTFGDSEIIVPNDGVYLISPVWGALRHSENNATIAAVFGIERDGFIIFSQRPDSALKPTLGRLGSLSGGGIADLKGGDKLSVWMASDVSGTLTLGNSTIVVKMIEDTRF